MIIQTIFIIIGFLLLIKGADFLVKGGSNIAKSCLLYTSDAADD